MYGRNRFLLTAVVMIFCLPGVIAGATPKELKRLDKKAAKSLARGDFDAALDLHRQILAATEPGEAIREDALYTELISKLSAEPADVVAAGPLLDELEGSFPRHPQQRVIAAVAALMRGTAELRASTLAASEELTRQAEQCAEIEKAAAEAAAQPTETCRDSRSLERQLRKVRSELETTQAELAKKDAALAQLKEALVSGG